MARGGLRRSVGLLVALAACSGRAGDKPLAQAVSGGSGGSSGATGAGRGGVGGSSGSEAESGGEPSTAGRGDGSGGDAGTDSGGQGTGGFAEGGANDSGGEAGKTGGNAGSGTGGGGTGGVAAVSCATDENTAPWDAGRRLYVDDDAGCAGNEPCFTNITGAIAMALSGDTIAVLPGTYMGFDLHQTTARPSLRITGIEGPSGTTITGFCPRVTGEAHGSGQIWIDHLTFGDCGASSSSVETGWGVYVTSWNDVEVRIQDNVFLGPFGRGAVGLLSSTVGTRFHAVVARNRFADHHGEDAALDVSLPADSDEDYCVRIANNVVTTSDIGIGVTYYTFNDGPGRFELVHNTVVGNVLGIGLAGPTARYQFTNNIVFGNTNDFYATAEMDAPIDIRNNLIGSGQFSGLNGNFAMDPLFLDQSGGDFRLLPASPAIDQGEAAGGAVDDVEGTLRLGTPDLGAFEHDGARAVPLADLACGDGSVTWGPTTTAQGTFLGFETCEDGNTVSGDGCSSRCQWEPVGAIGQISLRGADLCVIRQDATLACWGDAATGAPAGTFQQVALSAYHGCALKTDGLVSCWYIPSGTASFMPPGTFTQIAADYDQTCGVRDDGAIVCWDEQAQALEQPGAFVRVDTNRRVCGLSETGEPTCWDPYTEDFPSGPFVQTLPDLNGEGCGLRPSGELVCVPDGFTVIDDAPLTSLVSFHADGSAGCGLRPDGRAVYWRASSVNLLLAEQPFIEVAAGFTFCCGVTPDRRAYCSSNTYGLPAE